MRNGGQQASVLQDLCNHAVPKAEAHTGLGGPPKGLQQLVVPPAPEGCTELALPITPLKHNACTAP